MFAQGLSWADSFRPNAQAWFDRQMNALEEFDVTLTYCFTPAELRLITPARHLFPMNLLSFARG